MTNRRRRRKSPRTSRTFGSTGTYRSGFLHNVPHDKHFAWTEDTQRRNASVANLLTAMGRRGESAYHDVDAAVVHDIPADACTGRTGAPMQGQTFTGKLDLETGMMRFDCLEDPIFYLQVDLNKMPLISLAPGGREHEKAAANFRQHVN